MQMKRISKIIINITRIHLKNNFIKSGIFQPESSQAYHFRTSESSKKMKKNPSVSLLGTMGNRT